MGIIILHFLSEGSAQWFPSQKYNMEKGGGENTVKVEKTDKPYTLARW